MANCVLVMLDNAHNPTGPATVVAVTSDPLGARKAFMDKDGCLPAALRIWAGTGKVGDRCQMLLDEAECLRRSNARL